MAQEDFNDFAKRVEHAESRGRRYGKDGKLLTSPKGAQGEMQVMPTTQTDPGFGVTPAKPGDDADIARVGRDYLAAMEKRYGGNREYAAVAYNWGPGNADKWIAKGADFSKLPPETQAYVQQVTGQGPSATAQATPKEVTPKTTPAADMGTGYQAALALSFLNDQEDDDEKAAAKLEEEQDSEAAKMLAEYKPFNALASLDLTSTAPQAFKDGGDVGKDDEEFTPVQPRETAHFIRSAGKMRQGDRELENVMLGLGIDEGMLGVNLGKMTQDGKEQLAKNLMASYNAKVGDLGINATGMKPLDAPAGTYMGSLSASYPIGEGRVMAGVNAMRTPDGETRTMGHNIGYSGKVGPGYLNATVMQPKGNPQGRQYQMQYSIPFADGGDVETPMLFSVPTYAETVSHEMYPGQGGQFDQKDAARHMLAAGTLARKYGENAAEMLGNLHEIKTSPLRWVGSKLGISQMPVDYEQDLHNNRVGIELAKRSKSQKDLEDLINMEAERAKSQQTPGAAWIGKPVRRAGGSPQEGENATTRSPQQLQAYMESMVPGVQVSSQNMAPGAYGIVKSREILDNIGGPAKMTVNAALNPRDTELTKLHELEHLMDLRGGDIKGRSNVRYSDNVMRTYYLMNNNWAPVRQTVENMVSNKEKLENFFGKPLEDRSFKPEFLEHAKKRGSPESLWDEQMAELSSLEQVTGKSLTQDPEMRNLFPGTKMMAVYDALTGPRQTRMDARDLPPHTPQPSYTYETNPVMRFIKQKLGSSNEYGIPVKRADGSPEDGERALTPEEIEAASKPAFLTPKSGLRRQISTKPGQIEGAFAQGVSETPYNLVGAPVDIATMAMRPFGYSVQNPVMGSEWIKEKMSAAGVRPQPPTSPTERAFYEAGQLGGGAINPTAPVRGTIAAAQKTGEAAKMLAKDIQQYNQQLAVPGASYAVRPRGGPLLLTDTKPGVSWHTANNEADLPSGVVDPVTPIIFDLAGLPDKPLKEWFRSKMGAYMRRDMGSPDDQFVKAAEEGKRLHFLQKPGKNYTQEQLKKDVGYSTPHYRKGAGFSPEGEAQTMYGKMVEGKVDFPLEPVRAGDLLGTLDERLIPPSMLAAAKADPEMRFYGLDSIILKNLQLEQLRDYMYKMRNSSPQFSAYDQPNVQIPERYRFTDEALKGLTPAQASERVAQAKNWFQDTRQQMASAAVSKNKDLISHEYDNGHKWIAFPDLNEDKYMLELAKDVGCDGKWCTRDTGHALSYGSEEGKRLNVLLDQKARPKAQITLQAQAGTPKDFIESLTGKDYDNYLNRHPHISEVLENDRPSSQWQFDSMLEDVANTSEYQNWASKQGAKITEIKGVNNVSDLKDAPFVGEVQDFVKRMDKQYGLQAVDNLNGIGMIDLATANDPASIIGSEIYKQLGGYDSYLRKSHLVTKRMQELNGGSTYMVTADTKRLVKQAVEDVMGPMDRATGGMIERRTDNSSRYL